jgi:uncharacterized protein YbjT (DUF2867 family)
MSTRQTNAFQTTLVLGGTGKTGRRVVDRLTARGHLVRVGSRSHTPAFDWDDRSTWPAAVREIGAAYINYYPDLATAGAARQVGAFVALALEHGVQRLVLLSGRGEEEAQRTEELLRSSGADWTIIRASWFAQNFSESFMADSVRAGELVLPAGNIGEPFVDADDIADVATAALTEDGHVGKLYELTGPRLLTFAEAVHEIALATGRDIRYVQISRKDFSTSLAEQGLPADLVWLLSYLFDTVLDGRNASLSDGVRRALGREPRDFADFARDAAAAGAWTSPNTTEDVHRARAASTTW